MRTLWSATSGDREATYLMKMHIEDRALRTQRGAAHEVARHAKGGCDPGSARARKQCIAYIVASRRKSANFPRRACHIVRTLTRRANWAFRRCYRPNGVSGHDQLPARVRFRNRHWRCGCTRDDRLGGRNPTNRRSSLKLRHEAEL